jgi:hypothetical protein
MKTVKTILACFLVAGCQTGGLGTPGSPAWQLSTTPEQKTAYFQDVCKSYGFKLDTPQMAQCMQNESFRTRQSASDSANRLSQYNSMQPRPVTNTTCRNINGILRCTTF